MSGALPILGLDLEGSGEDLVPLLTALRAWCRPTGLRTRGTGTRGAVGQPVAAVLADHVPDQPPDVPYVVVSADPAVVAAGGPAGHLAPDGVVDPGVRFVPPFVRERLRSARTLPDHPVLVISADGDARWDNRLPVDADLLDTAFACASLAVVGDPAIVDRALAWGTPLLVPYGLAETLALPASGPDAIVAVDEDPAVLAREVRRLARMSWRGRRWWENRHDPTVLAARIAADLLPASPLAAQVRLAELGTPPGAHVRERLRDAWT